MRTMEPKKRATSVLQRALSLSGTAGLVFGLVIPVFLSAAPAQADNLDDQASTLQQQADEVQSSLEFVDAGIAKSAANLTLYTGMLPGAQQALAAAQNRVAAATGEVESLAARVDLAQQNKDKITAQIASDQQKAKDSQKIIGQIAAQSYKSGGLPTGLSLFLGSDSADLVDGLSLADQAMRSQTTTLSNLNQQNAVNVNSQARLTAVEAEIKDLKAKADAALIAEKAAQDEAAAQKAKLDKLVADTAALSKELNAKKPQIQAKLAAVKTQQDNVAAQIAERARKAREAAAAAAAAAAKAAGNNNYQAPPLGNPSAFGLVSPFAGFPITSGWGWRLVPPGTIDFNGTGSYLHTGIDYGVPCGTAVRAPAAGTIAVAGWLNNGGGFTVHIDHGVVQGNALTTVYYHNSSVAVSVGQHVNRGDIIAYSGGTGNSTGCHAHFETWVNGQPVDPSGLL
ncbi:murein DD-endopeptidase MepM/ murein hydrolase activator NlpD [Psychromicrobium silvestre]|uniref:Murein DD-endopeptidase MepM/ murein hydrolase activator NlpD n=1 Tax=Psychromicrobium silvestre TaxID=1645614 RepID=A0A7Y9LSM8_9MICC|nr:M23 family metallopeptidase [Psychromicrobium silvestre]NYE94872.1 murein DD-endopeptidase MepM/ murein hydrolase activator NlpD [Psychromicrobium silvestre]